MFEERLLPIVVKEQLFRERDDISASQKMEKLSLFLRIKVEAEKKRKKKARIK